jgi:hypothetical protein
MLRTRLFVFLVGCFALTSASWADGTAYVDCAKYPGNTQVLDKAGMTSGAVAFIPCGERFTILVRGEFFTQIQTKDGKVGYLNTYMITITPDTAAATQQQSKPSQTSASATTNLAQLSATDKFKIISTTPSVPVVAAQPTVSIATAPAPAAAPAVTQPPAAAPASTQASVSTPAPSPSATAAQVTPTAPAAQSQPAAATQPQTPPATQPSPIVSAPAPYAAVDQPKPSVPESQPAPVPAATTPAPAALQPPAATPPAQTEAPATPPVAAASAPASSSTTSSADTQPTAPAAQPEPPAAQPQPEPIHPKVMASQIKPRSEKNPSPYGSGMGVPTMELFAGYGFTRFGGGNGTNLNGALGSFGWNFKPWLQIIGDASYNFVTVSGTKSVLYGNHFGPRIYLRSRSAHGPIPFAEGLVGGSRVDTTTAGVTTSQNGITYKAGGGVDLAISRHISVRAIEADYYRVPFLTASQTNYVASAGVIFRFGGRPRY